MQSEASHILDHICTLTKDATALCELLSHTLVSIATVEIDLLVAKCFVAIYICINTKNVFCILHGT